MKMRNILYAFVAAVLLGTAICSCRSVKYVPVETVRHDTLYINKVRRDSIVKYDSVHVREKGDTVWLEKYRYLFVDKWRTDTLYVSRTDSVQVPYPVERELTRWQRFRMEVGGVVLFALLAGMLGIAGWLAWKRWRK